MAEIPMIVFWIGDEAVGAVERSEQALKEAKGRFKLRKIGEKRGSLHYEIIEVRGK